MAPLSLDQWDVGGRAGWKLASTGVLWRFGKTRGEATGTEARKGEHLSEKGSQCLPGGKCSRLEEKPFA